MKIDAVQQCFREINQPTWMASVRLGTSKLPESATASNPYQLPKDYPAPREVLRQHFPRTAKQCFFRGGWGYSIDDAVEVLEFDPEINPDEKFDGVSLEYAFIDKFANGVTSDCPGCRTDQNAEHAADSSSESGTDK